MAMIEIDFGVYRNFPNYSGAISVPKGTLYE
jgi:hypothetical protein